MLRSVDPGHGSGHDATTGMTVRYFAAAPEPICVLKLVFPCLPFTGDPEVVSPVHLVPPGSDRDSGRGARHLESRGIEKSVECCGLPSLATIQISETTKWFQLVPIRLAEVCLNFGTRIRIYASSKKGKQAKKRRAVVLRRWRPLSSGVGERRREHATAAQYLYARSAGHQSPRSNSKPPTSGLFGNSRLRFVATVSSRPVLIRARQVLQEALLVPPTHCHASIRTLIGPLWARCKLGFGLMPRSMFGADIFGAIS